MLHSSAAEENALLETGAHKVKDFRCMKKQRTDKVVSAITIGKKVASCGD